MPQHIMVVPPMHPLCRSALSHCTVTDTVALNPLGTVHVA